MVVDSGMLTKKSSSCRTKNHVEEPFLDREGLVNSWEVRWLAGWLGLMECGGLMVCSEKKN